MSNLINTIPMFTELGHTFATSGGVPGLGGCHSYGGRVARATRGRAGAASEGAYLHRSPTGVLSLSWITAYAPFGDTDVRDATAEEAAAFHAAYTEAWEADAPTRRRTAAWARLHRVAAIRRRNETVEAAAWRRFQAAKGAQFAPARLAWLEAARLVGAV